MTYKNTARLASVFIMAMFLIVNQGCATNPNHSKNTVDKAYQTKSDLEITQDIRQALVADKSLSSSAHNVKVYVSNGVVRLRGLVSSFEEKAAVVGIASHVTGMKRIIDEMGITSK